MRNFRDLKIWKESIIYTIELYSVLEELPKSERYGLYSQMTRASVSIPSNIAEGCRGSVKELKQYLNIALGSSFELESQLIIVERTNMLESSICQDLIIRLNSLQKQINAYRTYISSL
ncbi:MAG: four helix bundle protein [Bacteroidia bacterium]|jgi:four helix bundle protein